MHTEGCMTNSIMNNFICKGGDCIMNNLKTMVFKLKKNLKNKPYFIKYFQTPIGGREKQRLT